MESRIHACMSLKQDYGFIFVCVDHLAAAIGKYTKGKIDPVLSTTLINASSLKFAHH